MRQQDVPVRSAQLPVDDGAAAVRVRNLRQPGTAAGWVGGQYRYPNAAGLADRHWRRRLPDATAGGEQRGEPGRADGSAAVRHRTPAGRDGQAARCPGAGAADRARNPLLRAARHLRRVAAGAGQPPYPLQPDRQGAAAHRKSICRQPQRRTVGQRGQHERLGVPPQLQGGDQHLAAAIREVVPAA